MINFLHLSFTHLFFRLIVFYSFICVIIIILCLSFTAFNHNNSIGERSFRGIVDGRGWWWQSARKGKKEEEGFYTDVFHCAFVPQRLECIKPLFKNTQLWSAMKVSALEESSECHGKIIYEFYCPCVPTIFYLFHIGLLQ